jgi:hypothetical protein
MPASSTLPVERPMHSWPGNQRALRRDRSTYLAGVNDRICERTCREEVAGRPEYVLGKGLPRGN